MKVHSDDYLRRVEGLTYENILCIHNVDFIILMNIYTCICGLL